MVTFTLVDPNTDRLTLWIGLSFGNLKKFRDGPFDSFIRVDGTEIGLPIDIVMFSGESEQEMARQLADNIGPQTEVRIDPKLRD